MEQTEEELEKLAWKVYANALESIEIPKFASIHKNDDGTFSCMLLLSYKQIGSSYIYFKPSIVVIKELLQFPKGKEYLPEDIRENLSYLLAKLFAYLFLKNFFAEMEETLSHLHEFPILLQNLATNEIDKRENKFDNLNSEKSRNYIDEFFEKRKQRVKKRIVSEIQNAEKPLQPVTHLIDYYYKDLLPKWEKAKNCYKKNKTFDNWEKMIAVSFDDLPTDLLKRLGDPDTYLAMPSSIALEHAARFCGIKPNSLGLRALQKYLQQSREWIKENGNEKVDEEAERYYLQTFEEVLSRFQMAHSLNNDMPSFDDVSLMHQIIADVAGNKIKEIIVELKSGEIDNELKENKSIH